MAGFPNNPIDAVTHPNPYPYYADLVARTPFYRDEALGLWVASSAEAVTAILTSGLCKVRPSAEPVPEALRETPAGTVFQHMVRFNDGEGFRPFRGAVSTALREIASTRAAEQSDTWARVLADEIQPTRDAGCLSRFAFHLPIYVASSLLGIPEDMLLQTATWAGDFARGLAPGSTPEEIARGTVAAGHLLSLFRDLVSALRNESVNTLLAILAREARRVGRDETEMVVANGIGFLFQAYDATAGLIGNILLVFASHPDVHARVVANPALVPPVIEEVLRYDPPIQNTRRFVISDGKIAGQEVHRGDAILVVLAAAGRDPAANDHPERFDMSREDRRTFTFGVGGHACPGAPLATSIARAAITRLLALGADPRRLAMPVQYRPSHNARIALSAME